MQPGTPRTQPISGTLSHPRGIHDGTHRSAPNIQNDTLHFQPVEIAPRVSVLKTQNLRWRRPQRNNRKVLLHSIETTDTRRGPSLFRVK